jgi:hypothetical protein
MDDQGLSEPNEGSFGGAGGTLLLEARIKPLLRQNDTPHRENGAPGGSSSLR